MCDYDLNNDLDRIDVLPLGVPETLRTPLARNAWSGDYELTELKTSSKIENLHRKQDLSRLDVTHSPTLLNSVRRWSQAISLPSRNNCLTEARENVCHLPSRKVFDLYKKLRLNTTVDPENEIWQLMNEIAQHSRFMKNTERGEQNRLELLRLLPQSLAIKRYIKERLSTAISEQNLTKTYDGTSNYFTIQKLGQMKLRFHKLLVKPLKIPQIWAAPIKEVRAQYGPNMSAYFDFLRMVLLLNIFGLACCVVFIVMPQKLHEAGKDGSPPELLQMINQTSPPDLEATPALTSKLLDLLTGEGYIHSSLMFYGTYTNVTLRASLSYSLPQAHFMTILVLFVLKFIFITISMAHSFSKTFLAVFEKSVHRYSYKIFSSWDYGISNQKSAEQNYFAIYTDLKESLSRLHVLKEKRVLLIRRILINTFAHFVVIFLIMGTIILQWLILKKSEEPERLYIGRQLTKAILVSITIIFLEWIFALIAKLEHYIPSWGWSLQIHLIRCFILEMLIILVFLYHWHGKLTEQCWESLIAREIYRLMISEMFSAQFFLPIIKTVLFHVAKRCSFSPNCYHPYFNISQGIIYSQTLCWLGLIFAPLIAIVIVLKGLLQFYLDRFLLKHIYQPSRKYWCDASLQSTYLGLTFLALMGVMLTYGYITTHIPLTACSPFRDYKYIFEVFLDGVLKLREDHMVWRVLKFCMRPAVVGGVLIMLTIMAYVCREKARAYKLMIKYLTEILIMEAKDKQLLLNKMADIGRNEEV